MADVIEMDGDLNRSRDMDYRVADEEMAEVVPANRQRSVGTASDEQQRQSRQGSVLEVSEAKKPEHAGGHGERPAGTHGIVSAVANFVNSIVGSGIIGLPFAYERGGFWVSAVLLVVIGALTAQSVKLIVRLGEAMGAPDYEILCERLLGRAGYYVVSYSMILFAYGAMLSYLILIGDTMAPVLGEWLGSDFLGNRYFVILLCAVCICLPLSSFRDIGKLGRTSSLSILCVIVLTLTVSARSFSARDDLNEVSGAWKDDLTFGWLGLALSPTGRMESATGLLVEPACHNYFHVAPGTRVPQYIPSDEGGQRFAFTSYTVNDAHATLQVTIAPGLVRAAVNASGALQLLYAIGSTESWSNPEGVYEGQCGGVTALGLERRHDLLHRAVPLRHFDVEKILASNATEGAVDLEHPHAAIAWRKRGGAQEAATLDVTFEASRRFGEATNDAFAFAHSSFFPALGVISFAYVCQHSSFLVRNSLRNPDDWNFVCNVSIAIATVLSLLMATFGYGNFQRCTRPDVLNNFMSSDNVANVARFLLACTMFFTYPMEFFVVRQAMTTLAFNGDASGYRHWVLTGIIFLVTVPPGLSLSSDQLGLVLEFTGGICASLLGFVLPGLCYYSYRRNYGEVPSKPCCTDGPPPAQTGSQRPKYTEILCTVASMAPTALVILGAFSMFFNMILGTMHAAGVDTYEYPAFCPDTGVE